MCGIFGWIARADQCPDPDLVRAATDTLLARGPDSAGYHFDGRVAFGMRRLSVIDPDGGDQPFYNAARTVAVVQNGEIYNFRELRRELERRGIRFQSHTDTEVLAHGYEVWGLEGLLSRLEGMYAIAISDRSTNSVHLIRDRLGEKPLYYCAIGDGSLIFASQLTTLLRLPNVDVEIEPRALDAYLAVHFVPGDLTMVRGVCKLLPAHVLSYKLDSNETKLRRYWQLQEPLDVVHLPEADVVEQLRERVSAAVSERLVADVPIGAFLSGGIDSSIVAACMRDHVRDLLTFSIGFSDVELDESMFARRVASWLEAQHHHFVFDTDEFLETLPEVVAMMDEPIGDQALLPVYWLSREARRHVTVVLSGEGADELFAGYDYYDSARLPADYRYSMMLLLRRHLAGADEKAPVFFASHNRTLSGFPLIAERAERRSLVRGAAFDESPWALAFSGDASRISEPLRQACFTDLTSWLPDDLLMKLDKMAMAHSLEGRAPYLDHELVQYVFGLPSPLKRASEPKRLLREAFRDRLPPEIVTRPKQGFVLPLRRWFCGPAGEKLRDALAFQDDDASLDNALLQRLVHHELANGAVRERWLFALLIYKLWLHAVNRLDKIYPRRSSTATVAVAVEPSVLFVEGVGGDTERYRVDHVVEGLASTGVRAHKLAFSSRAVLEKALRSVSEHNVIVFHRVPAGDRLAQAIVTGIRERGAVAIFDADDLVFEPAFTDYFERLAIGGPRQRRLVESYQALLGFCGVATCATEFLQRALERRGISAHVLRNGFSAEMMRLSALAVHEASRDRDVVEIGYASGTPTHRLDFASVAEPLREVLAKRRNVRLHIVGPLELPGHLADYAHRVRRTDFVHWTKLPQVLAGFDINLAPLREDEPFCQAKSELKWLEAALVGVPSVCSRTEAFEYALQDGDNGLLATTETEWYRALLTLVDHAATRRRLGDAARLGVLRDYAPEKRGAEAAQLYRDVLSRVVSGTDAPSNASAPSSPTVALSHEA